MAASGASFAPKEMPMIARLPALLLTPERDTIRVGSPSVSNARIAAPAGQSLRREFGPANTATIGSSAWWAISQSSTRETWPERRSRNTATG